jgi:alpha-aminoadipic semialdehyde synthase
LTRGKELKGKKTSVYKCVKNYFLKLIKFSYSFVDHRAQRAGITIMNEIGLDPGIDHLSAMKMIDEVKAEGGKVTSFVSWCGGLPAPEASNVPLSYKFSWSPRGVLTAGLNDAKFRMHNGFHEIAGKDLMKKHFPDVPIYPGFNLEGVANRDSLSYAETYGLGPVEKLDTMFRGTLRYKGYADLMYSFNRLGLLNAESSQQGFNTWVRRRCSCSFLSFFVCCVRCFGW